MFCNAPRLRPLARLAGVVQERLDRGGFDRIIKDMRSCDVERRGTVRRVRPNASKKGEHVVSFENVRTLEFQFEISNPHEGLIRPSNPQTLEMNGGEAADVAVFAVCITLWVLYNVWYYFSSTFSHLLPPSTVILW